MTDIREPRTIDGYYKNGDMETVRNLCKVWRRNKMTNPITSKPLPAGTQSKIYQKYEKLCKELGIRSTTSSSRNAISATASESSDLLLAKHISNLDIDENLDTVGRWAFGKCANDDPITLMPFDNDDKSVVTIRVRRPDGKFVKKGMCITKRSLYQLQKTDYNSMNYETLNPSSMYMSNWIQKSAAQSIEDNGMGGCAGGKVFVKLPPNNIFVSLKSFLRLMTTHEKEWFAVPMFNNQPQRIGNMFSMMTIIGSNHGQAPGTIIYKLHTRDEVTNQPHLLGKEAKDEYHMKHQYYTESGRKKYYIYKPTLSDLNKPLRQTMKNVQQLVFEILDFVWNHMALDDEHA